MAEATSLSLKSVQAAVKAAVAEFPKFNVAMPEQVTVSYLIRGIPIYEPLATSATLGELQAFANAVAGHLTAAQPELLDPKLKSSKGKGAVLSFGGHVVCGIPPVT
jgi:hypothetical protein